MPIADFEQKHASFDLGVYKIILTAGELMERSKGKGQGWIGGTATIQARAGGGGRQG